MGWRDTQRAVASGAMSFRPEAPDDIREGIGLLLKTRANSIMDAAERQREASMVAMEEAKERRKKIHEEREAQEKLDKTRTKQARMILSNINMDAKDINMINHVKGNLEVFGDDAAKTLAYYEDLGERFTYAASQVDMAKPGRAGDLNQQTAESMGLDATKMVETPVGKSPTTVKTDARNKMEVSESSGDPTASVVEARKGRKHAGLLGFGQARLEDYNRIYGTTYTPDTFAQLSVAEQDKVGDWHFNDISNFIRSKGLDKFIGEEINGTVLTESSIVAMAHLGGKTGVLRYLQTDGKVNAHDLVIDKNGKEVKTYMSDYARKFANSGSFTMQEDTGGLDPAFKTPVILPKKPDVDKDDPTSFEQMLVQSLQNDPSFQALPRQEQQQRIAAAKQTLMKQSQGETTLTASALAFKIANAEKVKMDPLASPADKEAAEKYLNDEAPIEKAAIESAAVSNKSPDTITAIIRNADGSVVQRDGTLVDGTFVPLGKEKLDLEDGQTLLMLQTPEKISEFAKELSRTKNERDKVGQDLDSAIEVTRTAYDLEQIVAQNPEILTFMGGAVQSTAQTLATEMKALLDHVESAFSTTDDGRMAASMTEEEVLNSFNSTILDKLSSADPETVEAYRRFNAKMTRFIFAAGKALGQSGNGFSNQDYINIRNSMLSGNLDRDFFNNMREFSRERLISADLATERYFKAGNMTFINSFEFAPYFMGNEGQTAKQYFDDLQRDTESDFNYYQWANSSYNGASPRADANIETLSRSKEDRAKWDAAPSGTNFNVQQRDGTYVTVTKP